MAPKIGILTCGFFYWLGIEHLFRDEEKKSGKVLEFWGKNLNISVFGVFLLKNEQKVVLKVIQPQRVPAFFFQDLVALSVYN